MYSSESGIDTDHEGRSKDLKLVAVVPNKAQYNLKEKLVLIFNTNLSDKGSYNAEFKGRKRSKMDVKAKKVNSCTLIVEAPIYHPVEQVKIHVRHRTYEGSTIIGSIPFTFLSREEILADILRDYTGDPVTFMCESLGISPSDISALDEALAITFKRNMPKGFNLLGLHNNSIGKEPCKSLHPTLLHFAAAFGLCRLTKDCLLQCPGVSEASKMKNCRGMKPNEIASNGGYEELAEEILLFQGQQEEDIYESMEEKDAEYLPMAPGYINVQLWSQPAYVEMEREQSQEANEHGYIDANRPDVQGSEDFYMDMTQSTTDDSNHGYVDADRSDVQGSDELYMDMTKPPTDDDSDRNYIDVLGEKSQEEGEDIYENQYRQETGQDFAKENENEQFYEAMVGDTGLGDDENGGTQPTYDTPSNLPVSQYPDHRSASVSLGAGGQRPRKPPKELPKETGTPPVPRRLTGPEATSPRERLPSTGSRISDVSNTSSVSGSSTSTTGSGHDGDAESDDSEALCMSRKELIKQLESKQKKERPAVSTKTPRTSYAGAPLPPVPPPADYNYQQLKSPPPVPSRGHCPRSPRAQRNHERSKTAPVNPIDVQLAQKQPTRNSSQSAKKAPGTRPSQGARPFLTKHPSSDLTSNSYGRAQESVTDQRRSSSEACLSRPPAPAPPGDRPPAPVPREPIPSRDPRSRLGGLPTPMVLAMERQVEEPPPAPRRGPSAQQIGSPTQSGQADEPPPAPRRGPSSQQGGPPKLQPRPAPRKR